MAWQAGLIGQGIRFEQKGVSWNDGLMGKGATTHELDIPNVEVDELIGGGGFAQVYRAYDRTLRRELAVKILRPVPGLELRRAFESEASAHGRLSRHPNIVTIHYAGHTLGGQPYLLMDFVSGGSLRDYLDENGPVPWQHVVAWMIPVCAAVQHVHDNGFIHRDIKPDNILLDPPGVPLLSDLGIACLQDETSPLPALSVPHAAPEALRGERRGVRSDVFSLGTTMFQLLTGEPPFGSDLFGRLHRVDDPPPVLPHGLDAPPWLDSAIRRALEPEVALRTATSSELRDELRKGAGRSSLRPPSVTARMRDESPPPPRHPRAPEVASRLERTQDDQYDTDEASVVLPSQPRWGAIVTALSLAALVAAVLAIGGERLHRLTTGAGDTRSVIPDASLPSVTEMLPPLEDPSTVGSVVSSTSTTSAPRLVLVPDLAGQTPDGARGLLPDGLVLVEEVAALPFRDADDGLVVTQSIPAGLKVEVPAEVSVQVGRAAPASDTFGAADVCQAQSAAAGVQLLPRPGEGSQSGRWVCVHRDTRHVDQLALCSSQYPGRPVTLRTVPASALGAVCVVNGQPVGGVSVQDYCENTLATEVLRASGERPLVSVAADYEPQVPNSWTCEFLLDYGVADFGAYCRSTFGEGVVAVPDGAEPDAWLCAEDELSGAG